MTAARRREQTLKDLGVVTASLSALSSRLADDFSADKFGFAQSPMSRTSGRELSSATA